MVLTRSHSASLSSMVSGPAMRSEAEIDELPGRLEKVHRHAVRDFTETWQEILLQEGRPPLIVAVKYLRYVNMLEQNVALSAGEKLATSKKIREKIRIWLTLKNDHIREVLGYQWLGEPRIVFHWYPNGNIKEYCEKRSFSVKANLLTQAAAGLVYLHQHKPLVVHGAINPSNIIINDEGNAILCDFGMADDIQLAEFGVTTSDRESGTVVAYHAPDLLNRGEHTAATDIYAFGSLIVELLSGHPPFHGLSYVKTLRAITNGQTATASAHPQLPPESPYWPIIEQCWRTEPKDRMSAEELYAKLQLAATPVSRAYWMFGALCSLFAGVFLLR